VLSLNPAGALDLDLLATKNHPEATRKISATVSTTNGQAHRVNRQGGTNVGWVEATEVVDGQVGDLDVVPPDQILARGQNSTADGQSAGLEGWRAHRLADCWGGRTGSPYSTIRCMR
jgi:hypothetical protein